MLHIFFLLHAVYHGRQREFGNLVLRHYVPIKTLPVSTFRRILETLLVEWRNSTPCFASFPEGKYENTEYNYIFHFPEKERTHNLSRLQPQIPFINFNSIWHLFYQLHAVSHTQQGRQREPSVATFRSPLSAEFWWPLNGRTQRRA